MEIRPIDKIFCNNREDTLIVGSVKSNIGHSENAAAHGQIIKVGRMSCFAFGFVPVQNIVSIYRRFLTVLIK